MNKLKALIEELEKNIPKQEQLNQAVSNSSVGWHIEHSLLAINLIIESLKKSNPTDYKWKFNFTRMLVYTMNKIPRGRGKAPVAVKPKDDFNTDTLKNHVDKVINKLDELNHLKPNQYFEHPYFGKLNVKPTIQFLKIHTRHHISIINDIIKTVH
jgi:hypothetical protein